MSQEDNETMTTKHIMVETSPNGSYGSNFKLLNVARKLKAVKELEAKLEKVRLVEVEEMNFKDGGVKMKNKFVNKKQIDELAKDINAEFDKIKKAILQHLCEEHNFSVENGKVYSPEQKTKSRMCNLFGHKGIDAYNAVCTRCDKCPIKHEFFKE